MKTSARKYSDLQVEASLQLPVSSYTTQMNGLAAEQDLRVRFDVLTTLTATSARGLAVTTMFRR